MNRELLQSIDRLPGWLSIHEGQFLHQVALHVKKKKGEIIEIGSFAGKSTIYLAKTGQKMHAIDPHKGSLDQGVKFSPTLAAFKRNIRIFGVEKFISLIQKTSQSAAENWNKNIKLLFIDGLHDEKNAKLDYQLWSPFLVDGSIVAMHDSFCGWEGAQKVALKYIVQNDQFYEVGVVGSIVYGIRGKSNFVTSLNRFRIRLGIITAYWIQKQKYLPHALSFFIIHRMIKLFLVNQFTVRR